jgi:predicted esterase
MSLEQTLEQRRAGRARRIALICTAAGLASMVVAPLARPAPPPAPPAPRPVTVVLHGLCGQPERACAPFVEGATSRGWLVCPRGEDPCGGGSRWRLRPSEDGRLIEDAVAALARAHDGQVDDGGRVLVGFSLGGIAAVRIAQSDDSRGRYTGLVVIASQVHPDAALLLRAGVRRVVLAAGDYDITSEPLREDARALGAASGRDGGRLEVRFVSLGKFGHGYPPDMQDRMREPMAWVSAAAPLP